MTIKTATRGGVETDLAAAADVLFPPATGKAVEAACRRLHRSRAQQKAWKDEQATANCEAFAALDLAGLESVTISLTAELEGDFTPSRSEVRSFDVEAARGILSGTVLDAILKPAAIDPEKFDAAREAGLISAEVAAAFVSVGRVTENVTMTLRTVPVEL